MAPYVLDISDFSDDERAVIELIVERVRMGRRLYGELRLSSDQRDWQEQFLQEQVDGAFYGAAGLIVMRRGR